MNCIFFSKPKWARNTSPCMEQSRGLGCCLKGRGLTPKQAHNFYKQGSYFPSGNIYMETHVRMKPKTCTRRPLKPCYLCFCSAFLVLFQFPYRYCLGIDSLFQDELFTGPQGFVLAPPPLTLVCCAVPGVCFCSCRGPVAERKRQRM